MKTIKKASRQRKNKMKTVGIIVAMAKEVAYLKNNINIIATRKICALEFSEGMWHDKKIVFTTSGIGKVNASMATILMIEHFKVDLIINTGIAGGYNRLLKPLDIVLASKVLYSDVDMTAEAAGSLKRGQLEGMPVYFSPSLEMIKKLGDYKIGTILTGDEFVSNYDKASKLVEEFFTNYDVLAFDMESGAVAQVCTINQIPFIIIRAISDIIGKTLATDYNIFSTKAADKVLTCVLTIINDL